MEFNVIKSILDLLSFLFVSTLLVIKAIFYGCLPKSYKKKKNFENEIVLITGGAGGIGRLVASKLAKLNAKIVLWDVDAAGLEDAVSQVRGIGGKAYGYKCDLTDREDVYKTATKVFEDVGQVTILINNAGIASGRLLLDTPDHLIQRTFDVNVLAHFWTTKAFLPKMIESNHGHIVTIASLAGYIGVHKLVDYCASKFAAVGFDESLRLELEKLGVSGVKTTVVSPYFIQATGMFNDVVSRFVPTLKSAQVADEIVEAIELEKLSVIIPRYLGILCLKWVLPWSVISLFMRNLVNNAAPTHAEVLPEDKKKEGKTTFQGNAETELNHRVHVTEKR